MKEELLPIQDQTERNSEIQFSFEWGKKRLRSAIVPKIELSWMHKYGLKVEIISSGAFESKNLNL